MAEEQLDVRIISDKVIWIVKNSTNRLPFYVERAIVNEKQRVIVSPAMFYTHPKIQWAAKMLDPRAEYQAGDSYIMTETMLSQVAQKVEGITPELHHVWKGQRSMKPGKREMKGEVMLSDDDLHEEFLKEIVSRTQIVSLPSMKVIWRAFIQTSLQWLLVKRKPINLGFMHAFAVPYRENWKSILMRGFPKAYRCFAQTTKEEEEKEMVITGLIDAFYGKELLEVVPTANHVHWKVEGVPTRLWDTSVKVSENSRIAIGKTDYHDFIASSIKRVLPYIKDAFRYFVCRSVAPSARLLRVDDSDRPIIFPYTPKGGVRPRSQSRSSGDICYSSNTVDNKKPKLTSIAEEEIEQVSRLRTVRSKVSDVRIHRGYLEESSDG